MLRLSATKALLAGVALATLVTAATTFAQGRPPARVHTATEAAAVTTVPATVDAGKSEVSITVSGDTRIITANGLPGHLVGGFPNAGNPHQIAAQSVSLTIPANPSRAQSTTDVNEWAFGISLFGVPFDPFAAEFWQGDASSGWNYNALGGAVPLGLDANFAHVQPNGAYHYHGVPFGLLELVDYDPSAHSPLVGYAADGFPIYALTGAVEGEVTQMTASWRLKSGERPGGEAPGGAYDGAFVQDWEYVEGLGNLDQCNGAMTVSDEYPEGTYAYFLTENYPVIPRCFVGAPSADFAKGTPT